MSIKTIDWIGFHVIRPCLCETIKKNYTMDQIGTHCFSLKLSGLWFWFDVICHDDITEWPETL